MGEALLAILPLPFLVGVVAALLLGVLMGWALWSGSKVELADETTVSLPVLESLGLPNAKPHKVVSWPVPTAHRLSDDTTRPILIRREHDAGYGVPGWAGQTLEVARDIGWGKHDPQCQAQSRTARPDPRFLGGFETAEHPVLDWSSYPTVEGAQLDGVA